MTTYLRIPLLLCACLTGYAQQGTVVLTVEGIQPTKGGEVTAGIFVKENFPKVGRQLIGQEKAVNGTRMQLTFTNVPAGDYGVVAFQDVDKNKLLKSNFMGFPTEPIGFSNGAKIKLGPPAFSDAKVTVQADKILALTIVLN